MKGRIIYRNEIEIEGEDLDDILNKFRNLTTEELNNKSEFHSIYCIEDAETFERLYEEY